LTLSPAVWIPSAVVLLVAVIGYFSTHRSSVWKEGESLRVAYREEALLTRTEMAALRKTLETTNQTLEATRQELAESRVVNAGLRDELRIARGDG
jgi:5-bromo-4-chloroindolyl phosphate hydrolysis protein